MKYFIVLIPVDAPLFVGKAQMRTLDNKMFDTQDDAVKYLRPLILTPLPFAMDIRNGVGEIMQDGITYHTFILCGE